MSLPWFKADNELWASAAEGLKAAKVRWPDALCMLDLEHMLSTRELPQVRTLAKRWGCSWDRAAGLVKRGAIERLVVPDADRTATGRGSDGDRTDVGRESDGATQGEPAQHASNRTRIGRESDGDRTRIGRESDADRTGAFESDAIPSFSDALDRDREGEEDREIEVEHILGAHAPAGVPPSAPRVSDEKTPAPAPAGRGDVLDAQAGQDTSSASDASEAPKRKRKPNGPKAPKEPKANKDAALIRSCTDVWAEVWKARDAGPYPWQLQPGGPDRRNAKAWASAVGASEDLTEDQRARLSAAIQRYVTAADSARAWPIGDPPTTGAFTRSIAKWVQEVKVPKRRGEYRYAEGEIPF